MAEFDFRDFYIGYEGHPRFQTKRIIVDDAVRVIVQKYEMIIFTNKGELFGDPEFGADLLNLLYQTKISANSVKAIIINQINEYIAELQQTSYTLEVSFQEDPENYQDVLVIDFKIGENEIYTIIS